MTKKTWNSWTCCSEDDEIGRPTEGYSAKQESESRVWRRRAPEPWLERAFQASLIETLERSLEPETITELVDEIRTELVERVKAEIATGTYRIPAEMLAEKLIHTMRGNIT